MNYYLLLVILTWVQCLMSINILIVLNTFLILIFSFLFNNLKMVLWEYEYRSDSIAIHPCNFNCGSYERPAITVTPAAKRQTRVPRLRLIETSGRLVNHYRTFTQVRYSRSKVHFSLRPQLLARVAGSPRKDCKKIISLSLSLSRFSVRLLRSTELRALTRKLLLSCSFNPVDLFSFTSERRWYDANITWCRNISWKRLISYCKS